MQEINNLSSLNQLYINNLNQQQTNVPKVDMTQKEDTVEINGQTKTLSTKKKVLIGAAILAATTAIAAAFIKRKNVSEAANKAVDEVKELIVKRNEVDIKKGVASLNNKPFTGVIEDSVSGVNSFKYRLEYENGVLIKSIKTQGDDILEKTYQSLEDGSRKITTNANGSISEKTFNTANLKEAVLNSKKEYKNLTLDIQDLSAEEFNKKSQEIQYLNKQQKAELEKIHTGKIEKEQKAAQIAKEEAQKAAKEAEELAQKEAQKLAEKQKILGKIKSNEEIAKMSKTELVDYEKQLHLEISSIKKKYEKYVTEDWYSKEDQELIKKLRTSLCNSNLAIDKINDSEKFNAIIGKINTGKNAVIKNKETGEDIAIALKKEMAKNGGTYRINASANDGKIYGLAEVCTPEYDEIINLPQGYCKNSLELKFLSGSHKSKGAGSALIKEVVLDSKKAGYNGKVWVDACGGSLPTQMSALAGAEKMQTSPVPFYFKQGFRFNDNEMNEAVQKGLENLKNGLAYDGPMGGNMFLTDEAIEKILNS